MAELTQADLAERDKLLAEGREIEERRKRLLFGQEPTPSKPSSGILPSIGKALTAPFAPHLRVLSEMASPDPPGGPPGSRQPLFDPEEAAKMIPATAINTATTVGGAALGTAAGALTSPVTGPAGPVTGLILGEMGGSRLGREINKKLGLEEPGAFGDYASIVAPPLFRGIPVVRPYIAKWARWSRAGKYAKQEGVRNARTAINRAHEQAMQTFQHEERAALDHYGDLLQAYKAQMSPIEAANTQLQEQYKRAQRVQNAARKAMQDNHRRLRLAAQKQKAANVEQARDLASNYPTPTKEEIATAYELVDEFDVRFSTRGIRNLRQALTEEEDLLAQFPALQSKPIQALAAEPLEGMGETLTLKEAQAVLTRLGQRVSSLKTASFPEAREQLGATQRLMRSIYETMEAAAQDAALSQDARTALQRANALYKRYRTLEELTDLVEQGIRTRHDGVQELNPAGILDKLRKGREHQILKQRLREIGVLEDLEKNLMKMAQATRMPPPLTLPRAPMQPGQDILGRARMRLPPPPEPVLPVRPIKQQQPEMPFTPDIQRFDLSDLLLRGFASSLAGGVTYASGRGSGTATIVSGSILAPSMVSRMFMTPWGQNIMLRLMEMQGPQLSNTTIAFLAALSRIPIADDAVSSPQNAPQAPVAPQAALPESMPGATQPQAPPASLAPEPSAAPPPSPIVNIRRIR